MKCPFCGYNDTKVIDSRSFGDTSLVRRRRECPECLKRFTTEERIENMPFMVIKNDNRREPFDRNKLREGILRACEKRPISIDVIEKIISEVEYEIQNYVMEIPSKVIGEKILDKLFKLDPVAYIRFASVYRQFQDIDSFMKELIELKQKYENTNKTLTEQRPETNTNKKNGHK
jgi:transcriptional repressor NrdR